MNFMFGHSLLHTALVNLVMLSLMLLLDHTLASNGLRATYWGYRIKSVEFIFYFLHYFNYESLKYIYYNLIG